MNSVSLLLKEPKGLFLIVGFVIIALFTSLVILWRVEKYDIKKINAQVKCEEKCFLEMVLSIDNIKLIQNSEKLELNEILYEFKIIYLSEEQIDYANNTYQILRLEVVDSDLLNNNILNISFLRNKEKMIRKIIKKFI